MIHSHFPCSWGIILEVNINNLKLRQILPQCEFCKKIWMARLVLATERLLISQGHKVICFHPLQETLAQLQSQLCVHSLQQLCEWRQWCSSDCKWELHLSLAVNTDWDSIQVVNYLFVIMWSFNCCTWHIVKVQTVSVLMRDKVLKLLYLSMAQVFPAWNSVSFNVKGVLYSLNNASVYLLQLESVPYQFLLCFCEQALDYNLH